MEPSPFQRRGMLLSTASPLIVRRTISAQSVDLPGGLRCQLQPVGVITLVPIGLIVLLQHSVRVARRRASEKPRSTMVVLPEGVVAYRRKPARAISFAHIAHVQLRVQAKRKTMTTYTTNADGTISTMPSMTTVPAAPSIWLDLVFHSGYARYMAHRHRAPGCYRAVHYRSLHALSHQFSF